MAWEWISIIVIFLFLKTLSEIFEEEKQQPDKCRRRIAKRNSTTSCPVASYIVIFFLTNQTQWKEKKDFIPQKPTTTNKQTNETKKKYVI